VQDRRVNKAEPRCSWERASLASYPSHADLDPIHLAVRVSRSAAGAVRRSEWSRERGVGCTGAPRLLRCPTVDCHDKDKQQQALPSPGSWESNAGLSLAPPIASGLVCEPMWNCRMVGSANGYPKAPCLHAAQCTKCPAPVPGPVFNIRGTFAAISQGLEMAGWY
jgi:hypothetical protein